MSSDSDSVARIERAIEGLSAALRRLDAAQTDLGATSEPMADAPPRRESVPQPAGRRADSHMDWIRADLSARYLGMQAAAHVDLTPLGDIPPREEAVPIPATSEGHVALASAQPALPAIEHKQRYALRDLLAFHDEAFVLNAYRVLMRREADPEGFGHYVGALRSGRMSRAQVASELRASSEGRAAGVSLKGLRAAEFFRWTLDIPLLGWLMAMVRYLSGLPAMAQRVEQLEAAQIGQHRDLSRRAHDLAVAVETSLRASERRQVESAAILGQGLRIVDEAERSARAYAASTAERIAALQASEMLLRKWSGAFGEQVVALNLGLSRLQEASARREEIAALVAHVLEGLSSLSGIAADVDAAKGKLALVEAGAKHALLLTEELRALQEAAGKRIAELTRSVGLHDASLDGFYADFEDRFRGTRDDIKSRQQVYLAAVDEAVRATGGGVVLDIGCGRGEWLETLKEHGLEARGVDMNRVMVERCRSVGLDVVESSALEYLTTLPEGSQGIVTAFHVIEHLAFGDLIALFKQAHRVLRPGGMMIFETPNPENLVVGACNFWYDPTHVRPLPPEMLKHVAESLGFARVELMRLHPSPEWDRLPEGGDLEARSRLNAFLYGARDYSIVAYKP